jgi:hypothetical protein
MKKGLSDTLCDETPGNYSFILEWVYVYYWHKMLETPGAADLDSDSDGIGDTDDENFDKSDSGGDDPSCDDNSDQDRDSSSDSSPFLLPI